MSNVEFFYRMYDGSTGTLVLCKPSEYIKQDAKAIGFSRLATFELPYQLDAAIAFAADPKNVDCFYKYNLFDGNALRSRGKHTIGSKREVSGIVAFGLDIDVSSKDPKYTDQETALGLLAQMPLPPSAIIGSNGPGGGLHAYWWLYPLAIQTPEHYEFTARVAKRWYRELKRLADPCEIDATSGPERLLRPPGALRTSGQLVTVLSMPGYRYSLNQFELPPDQPEHDPRTQENEDSVILEHLYSMNICSPEPIIEQAGWVPRSNDPSVYDRPESTSGAPSGRIYASGDGRVGLTVKTPGQIKTLAHDPITGERLSTAVEGTPKWLNLQATWVLFSQGGLDPQAWLRASAAARRAGISMGEEFSVIAVPTTVKIAQRAGTPEQVSRAGHAIKTIMEGDRDKWLYRAAIALVEIGLDDAQACQIASEAGLGVPGLDLVLAIRQAEASGVVRGLKSLPAANVRGQLDPQELALRILHGFYSWYYDDPLLTGIRNWNDDWYRFTGKAYEQLDREEFRSILFAQIHKICGELAARQLEVYYKQWLLAEDKNKVKKPQYPAPTAAVIETVEKHIKAQSIVLGVESLPYVQGGYVQGEGTTTGQGLVIFENGVGEIVEGVVSPLKPHTPKIFSVTQLPFAFDKAAKCDRWMQFLLEVFGIDGVRDVASENLLQEWMGLLLVQDQSFHKILNVIGPPRSGKGTISRVIEMLLGPANVAHPRLDQLLGDFGLASLVNKTAIIIEDSRLGTSSSDKAKILSLLLGISAADKTSIGRKFKNNVDLRLPGRVMIFSNELTSVFDPSGAFASRLLLLQTRTSYLGREDTKLEDKLRGELPGIFNWALEGLNMLRQMGSFTEAGSTSELREIARYASSPILEFITEFCEVGKHSPAQEQLWRILGAKDSPTDAGSDQHPYSISKAAMYNWFTAWYEAQGYHRPSKAKVNSMLVAAFQFKGESNAQYERGQPYRWFGVRLKREFRLRSHDTYFDPRFGSSE